MSRDVPDVTVVSKHSFSDRKSPPDYPADCLPDCPRLKFPVNEMPSWVAQSKEHNSWFKKSTVSFERSFPLITILDVNIVVLTKILHDYS